VLAAFEFPPIDELFRWKDIAFKGTPYAINKTSVLVFLSSAAILLIFVGGSRRMKLIPKRLQNVLEMTYEFIDRGVVRDVIGDDAVKFTPFLGSLFLFILFLNLWEIIPFMQFPPTSRIAIPAYLAIQTYLIMLFFGFKTQGFKYVTRVAWPREVPLGLRWFVGFIELISVFLVRPFSLAVRLLANMMAGHILLTALALLTAYALTNAPIIAIGPFAMLVGVTAFELLVGFLQAYIFTLLTAVYLDDSLHPAH
jgi:F-type H+-transporting ATPase subunit a